MSGIPGLSPVMVNMCLWAHQASSSLRFLTSKVLAGLPLYLLRAAGKEARRGKLFVGVLVGGLQTCRGLKLSEEAEERWGSLLSHSPGVHVPHCAQGTLSLLDALFSGPVWSFGEEGSDLS